MGHHADRPVQGGRGGRRPLGSRQRVRHRERDRPTTSGSTGLPYERLEGFIKSSPVTYVKHAKTPTLILQGTEDTTDPQGQSDQLYRPLKRYGVEAEYVLYPREGHGLREEKHLLDRLNRIIAWYEKHLK